MPTRRANLKGVHEQDTLVEDVESGKPLRQNAYELMRLRDAQSFITKLYWLVVICFLGIGITIAAVLSDGTFRDVFMAETLLSTIGITTYIVIVVMMLMCHSHKEMRVILLLFITFYSYLYYLYYL